MKKLIVAVRDNAASQILSVALEDSDFMAYRSFESSWMTSRARKEGLLWSHPENFELWCLGTLDTDSGSIVVPEFGKYKIVSGDVLLGVLRGRNHDSESSIALDEDEVSNLDFRQEVMKASDLI